MEAVKAVFRCWDNPRANVYRRMNEIPYDWGTAVNVQAMVFGNCGNNCGTGVAFTRNPATGEKALFGEYLINAQGEDVVAGIRTPSPIAHLKDQMPEVYDQFVEIATRLENHYKDMQDMEFTIEDGKLYMLQTRNGKRTAAAALKIAVDLVDEGMIDEREAVLRVEPKQLDSLLHPQFDAEALKKAEVIGKGLAASPGAACGQVVFTAEDAKESVENGSMKKVVLVRLETSSRGHRGHGGCAGHPDRSRRHDQPRRRCGPRHGHLLRFRLRRHRRGLRQQGVHPGRQDLQATATGSPSTAPPATSTARPSPPCGFHLRRLRPLHGLGRQVPPAEGLHQRRHPARCQAGPRLRRRGHRPVPHRAHVLRGDRIKAMREMIVAENTEDRKKALAKIMPYQQGDFEACTRPWRAPGDHPLPGSPAP